MDLEGVVEALPVAREERVGVAVPSPVAAPERRVAPRALAILDVHDLLGAEAEAAARDLLEPAGVPPRAVLVRHVAQQPLDGVPIGGREAGDVRVEIARPEPLHGAAHALGGVDVVVGVVAGDPLAEPAGVGPYEVRLV